MDNQLHDPGLRERKKREKRGRILLAARQVFAEKGFEGATTREIARLADVGGGTLFVYFKDKEDLLFAIFEGEIEAAQELAFATLPSDGTLVDELTHIFGSFYDFYGRDLRLSRAIVKELLFMGGRPDMEQLNHRFFNRLEQLLVVRQARGELRPDLGLFLVITNSFAAYFMGLSALVSGYMSREMVDTGLRGMLTLQVEGLLLRSAPEHMEVI